MLNYIFVCVLFLFGSFSPPSLTFIILMQSVCDQSCGSSWSSVLSYGKNSDYAEVLGTAAVQSPLKSGLQSLPCIKLCVSGRCVYILVIRWLHVFFRVSTRFTQKQKCMNPALGDRSVCGNVPPLSLCVHLLCIGVCHVMMEHHTGMCHVMMERHIGVWHVTMEHHIGVCHVMNTQSKHNLISCRAPVAVIALFYCKSMLVIQACG